MVAVNKPEVSTSSSSDKNNVTIIRSASSGAQVNAWPCRWFL